MDFTNKDILFFEMFLKYLAIQKLLINKGILNLEEINNEVQIISEEIKKNIVSMNTENN